MTHYLCIGCPLGCRLEVEDDEDKQVIEVRGFQCKIGKEYGAQEHVDPRRVVTTTVRVEGGLWTKLPVKTSIGVPKGRVGEVCRALEAVTMKAPVKLGAVVLADVLGTGADFVATRDMPADE